MNFHLPDDPADGDDDFGEDPISAAFAHYRRAARDIVPRRPKAEYSMADLAAVSNRTTTVTHYEVDIAEGVTRHKEKLEITRPILPEERNQ